MDAAPSQRRPNAADMPDLFRMIAEGASLRKACVELGIHAPSTISFIDSDDRLREQYAHARAVQGDGYGAKVGEVAQAVLDGDVPPDVGRAAMDGFKWTAGRMAPKRWGDKVAHEVSGPDGGPIPFDLSRLPDERLAQLEDILTEAAAANEQPGP